jgi:flagellar hook-length control protein FliK
MQISDLNNGLLKMIAGQSVQKTENPEQIDFAGMLDMAVSSEKEAKVSFGLVDNKSVNSSINVSAEGSKAVENKAFDVKSPKEKVFQVNNQSKVAEEKSQNGNEAEKTEKTQKAFSEEGDKVEKSAEKEQSAPNKTEKVENAGDSAEFEDLENVVLTEETLPSFVLVNNEESSPVSADNMRDDEANFVLGANVVENETVLAPVEQNQDIEISETNEITLSLDGAENEIYAEDVEKFVATNNERNVGESAIPQKQDFASEQVRAEVENVVENGEKNIVQNQEEKIAELLPEDKKVEIKVKVKKDVVEVSSEQKNISQDVLGLQKVAEKETDVIVQPVKENKISESVPVAVQPAPIQQNDGSAKVAAEVQKEIAGIASAQIENLNQEQIIAPVIHEIKTISDMSGTESFKDIYNKGITKEVSEQIKVNITQSAIKGVDKIEIQLKPASLGQVEIKLHIGKEGQLQAHIIASNQETLELIQKDFESLKDAFNQAGYQANDESFSFSYRGENQENNEKEKLREFIGDVLTQEVAEEMAANDYVSTDGVNIRV